MPANTARVSRRPPLHQRGAQRLRDESPAAQRLARVLNWHEELRDEGARASALNL
jgi:hypothetical protein